MELRCVSFGYRDNYALILPGQTTKGMHWTDEEKQAMYEDYPGRFEVVEGTEVQTPEDSLVVETPENRMPKTRKK